MYRTYHRNEVPPGALYSWHWDGDNYIWTVYESREEYDAEQARLARIEQEYNEAMQAYRDSLR